QWLTRLAAEHDNFSAALSYAIGQRDVRTALRFVGALTWFWVTRDYDSEAGEWATAVRELAGDTAPEGLPDAYAICELVYQLTRLQPEFPDPPRVAEIVARIGPLIAGTSHPMLALVGPMAAVLSGQPEDARGPWPSWATAPIRGCAPRTCCSAGTWPSTMATLTRRTSCC